MPLKNDVKFSTTADIRQKLNNSVVTYDGVPVYCQSTGESSKLTIYGLITKDGKHSLKKEIEYDDDKFVPQSPPLGYINITPNLTYYASRIPARRFSIGLLRDSIEFRNITGQGVGLPFTWPWSEELHNTIINKYPTPVSILERLYKKDAPAWSQAFTRTLAFGYSTQNGLRVFHKNTPIAYYNPTKQKFCPLKDSQSLVENILVKHGIKFYAP